MQVQLIAFDLDGTLLDDEKCVPDRNKAALKAAHDAGILLVPATGRILKGMPEELMELGLFRYFIFSNGALVYDAERGESLFRAGIEPDLAIRVCEYMDTLPVLYDCYREGMGYMTAWMYDQAFEFFASEPEILKLVKRLRIPVPELKEDILKVGVPLEKLQMYFREEDTEERAKQLSKIPRIFPELISSSSTKNNVEINSARAGKGKALQRLCEHLGIDPAAAVAFGDGLNDSDLLLAAGRGCAVANAAAAVKECADVIVESNLDAGVGREVFRLLNSEPGEAPLP